MAHGITGIDHPVIAVRDMEAARAAYERLGFVVPPRGSHLEWGTGNWCIMFPEDYLELRGIVDAGRPTHGLEHFLARREGVSGIAFATIGAQASHDMLVESGLHPRPVVALRRNFELPEGWVQPEFRLCFPAEAEVPGLMSVVICEHRTPELIRRPEFLEHQNGVRRVASMTGVMAEPAAAEAALRKFLGDEAVRREGRRLRLDCGRNQSVVLVPPDELAALHGNVRFTDEPEPPYLAAVVLEVENLDQTRAVLERNAVAHSADEGRLRVAPAEACGVLLEFAAAA